MRILIAGPENARLVALSGYLTFRGFIVDQTAPEGPHTVAVVQSTPLSTAQWPDADLILGAELPMPHLASVVCASLAG